MQSIADLTAEPLTLPAKPTVFVLSIDDHISVEVCQRFQDHWDQEWLSAGAPNPPSLIILSKGMRIYPLELAE